MKRLLLLVLALISFSAFAETTVFDPGAKPVLEKKWTKRSCEAAGGDWEMDVFGEDVGGTCHFGYKMPKISDASIEAATCVAHMDRFGEIKIYCCNSSGHCQYLTHPDAPEPMGEEVASKHTKRTCEAHGGEWDPYDNLCYFGDPVADEGGIPAWCLIYPQLCGNSKGGRMQIDLNQKVAFSCTPFQECEIECQPNCPDPEIKPPQLNLASSSEAKFCRSTGGKWHKYKGCVYDSPLQMELAFACKKCKECYCPKPKVEPPSYASEDFIRRRVA